MFEKCLVGDGIGLRQQRRSGWSILASIGVQTLVCMAIMLVPMLWPTRLPVVNAAPQRVSLALPVPVEKLVKPQLVKVTADALHVASMSRAEAPQIQRAIELVHGGTLAHPSFSGDFPPLSDPAGAGYMRTGIGSGSSPFGGTGDAVGGPAVTLAKPSGKVVPTISQGVSAGLLLAPIRPIYPHIAVMTRQQGTVVLTATIDRTGHIVGLQVQGGPVLFRQSALDAVAAAHYRPYLLNGQPTEVITTITVNFTIGASGV